MPYGILADLVVILHFSFVIFAVLGGLLAFIWHRIIWLHIPVVLWAVFIELSGHICPLTPLENSLRLKSGSGSYSGGFVENYIMPVLYPIGLTREIQLLLGGTVLLINIIIYWQLLRHRSVKSDHR